MTTPGPVMDSFAWTQLTTDVLARGATARLPARGGSMRPFIPDGCVVVVEPVRAGDLRIGDVALLSLGGQMVIHRVVRRRCVAGRPAVQTKGDAVCELDAWACEDAVLGRVVSLEQDGKTVSIGVTALARFQNRAVAALSLHGRRWQGAWLRYRARRHAIG